MYTANVWFHKHLLFIYLFETKDKTVDTDGRTCLIYVFLVHILYVFEVHCQEISRIRYRSGSSHRRHRCRCWPCWHLPISVRQLLAASRLEKVACTRMWKSVKCALFAGFNCKYSNTLLSTHTHLPKDGANKILTCMVSYAVNLSVKVHKITYTRTCFDSCF